MITPSYDADSGKKVSLNTKKDQTVAVKKENPINIKRKPTKELPAGEPPEGFPLIAEESSTIRPI